MAAFCGVTHPDHGLYEGRLSFVIVVGGVDICPVGEGFRHERQVASLRGFVEQLSGMELPDVLRVGRLRLHLQFGLAARVLRHFSLCEIAERVTLTAAGKAELLEFRGLTLLCDSVHHRAEHQDVGAAVCAAAQTAVAAQTCRTGRCHHMDMLGIAASFTKSSCIFRLHSRSLLRGPDPVSK